MKFAKYLDNHAVPEWRRKYIDYKYLKKLLRDISKNLAEQGIPNGFERFLDLDQHVSKPAYGAIADPKPKRVANQPQQSPQVQASSEEEETITTPATRTVHFDSPNEDGSGSPEDGSPRDGLPSSSGSGDSQHPILRQEDARTTGSTQNPVQPNERASLRQRQPRNRRQPFFGPEANLRKRHKFKDMNVMLNAMTPEERNFFSKLDDQLDKVEAFYQDRESAAVARLKLLKAQLDELDTQKGNPGEPVTSQIVDIVHRGAETLHIPFVEPRKSQDNSPGRQSVDISPQGSSRVSAELGNVNRRSAYRADEAVSYTAARRRLKKAMFEFYRGLELLKNYRILNRTGFAKIMKKFDKNVWFKASEIYMPKVNSSYFVSSKVLNEVFDETEELFAKHLEKGDRKKAMNRLRVPKRPKTHHMETFRVGAYIGLAIPALIHGAILASRPDVELHVPNWSYFLQIYGALMVPIIFGFLFTVNMWAWHEAKINYVFIFEFDVKDNISYQEFMELPAFLFLVLSYLGWLTFQDFVPVQVPDWFPLVFVGFTLVLMFNPLNFAYRSARFWLLRALWRLVFSGFYRVEFRDFFLGDELVSLSFTFVNLALVVCVYEYHWTDLSAHCRISYTWVAPAIGMLPPWWRFIQCLRRYRDSGAAFPHLVNAGKYANTVVAIWFLAAYRIYATDGAFIAWVFFQISNTIYTTSWDLAMDWGLLRPHAPKFFLREELAFRWTWAYYWAMVTNFMIRSNWVVFLIPTSMVSFPFQGFIVGGTEALRRFQWNFFRMENEHLNNIGEYRAERVVPLPYTHVEEVDSDEMAESKDKKSFSLSTLTNKWNHGPHTRDSERRQQDNMAATQEDSDSE